jgi:hypothetical protein
METVSLSFNDFDLIIHSFQGSRMNRIFTVVADMNSGFEFRGYITNFRLAG